MINISDNGDIDVSTYKDFEFVEKYAPVYDSYSRYLLSAFLDIDDEPAFMTAMNHFAGTLVDVRKQWKEEKDRIGWAAPPPLAAEVFTDLR